MMTTNGYFSVADSMYALTPMIGHLGILLENKSNE